MRARQVRRVLAGMLSLVLLAAWLPASAAEAVALKASEKEFKYNGASGSISYSLTGGTPGTEFIVAASTEASWIHIDPAYQSRTIRLNAKGTGKGSVKYRVDKYELSQPSPRTGVIQIADQQFTVSQTGAPCKVTLGSSSSKYPDEGDDGLLSVTAPGGCGWAVSVDGKAPWISLEDAGAGVGNGSISYSVAPNCSAKGRTGKVYITTADARPQTKTHTVTQAACALALEPAASSLPGEGDNGLFTVHAPGGCEWAATVDAKAAAWLQIEGAGFSTGEGSVAFTAAENETTKSRSGKIYVSTSGSDPATKAHSVKQAKGTSILPNTYSVTYNGNGSTGGGVPTDANRYQQGQTVIVLGNTGSLVRTGYSFVGWNTQANGSGTAYTPSQTFTMSGANTTLYAEWTPAVIAQTVSGKASAGAPLIGSVTLKDSSAPPVTRTVAIEADGSYTIDVSGLTAPFMLLAKGQVGASSYALYSAAVAADVGGNVNVTPLTDLILTGMARQIAANYYANGDFSNLTREALDASEAALQSRLQPVLSAMGLSNSIDLLRSSYNTDHTGLDAVIDLIQITVDPQTSVAVITNIVNQESVQVNYTTQSYSGTFTSDPMISQSAADIQAIADRLATFTGFFATSFPAPTNPQLLALFDASTFMDSGSNLSQFLDMATTDPKALGMQFTNLKIDAIDPGAGTCAVEFAIVWSDGRAQAGGFFPWHLTKKNGAWLIQGDQRIAWVGLWPVAYYSVPDNGLDTGLALVVGTTSDAVILDSRIASAVFKGPGLPAQGITLNAANDFYLDYTAAASGGVFSDVVIGGIPDNAVYSFELFDAGNHLLTNYTQVLAKRPLALGELSAASFPNVTAPTLATLRAFNGGSLSAAWTLPDGQRSHKAYLRLSDNNGHRARVSQGLIGSARNTTLLLQPVTDSGTHFTPTDRRLELSSEDEYARRFETSLW